MEAGALVVSWRVSTKRQARKGICKDLRGATVSARGAGHLAVRKSAIAVHQSVLESNVERVCFLVAMAVHH